MQNTPSSMDSPPTHKHTHTHTHSHTHTHTLTHKHAHAHTNYVTQTMLSTNEPEAHLLLKYVKVK